MGLIPGYLLKKFLLYNVRFVHCRVDKFAIQKKKKVRKTY
mgnify:CR=1 FL=1